MIQNMIELNQSSFQKIEKFDNTTNTTTTRFKKKGIPPVLSLNVRNSTHFEKQVRRDISRSFKAN